MDRAAAPELAEVIDRRPPRVVRRGVGGAPPEDRDQLTGLASAAPRGHAVLQLVLAAADAGLIDTAEVQARPPPIGCCAHIAA
jgi:hypothetical protein